MAKVTMGFGVALILLGAWAFIGTGAVHPTAMIPTYFGLVIAWSGYLARSENPKQRMLWMHVAVTVGLLGFIGAAVMAVVEVLKAHGGPLAHPPAVASQVAMAVLCGIFVWLCVRSFIEARRTRKLEA